MKNKILISVPSNRDGRPAGICWCGYPKAVCGHGAEIKRKAKPLADSKLRATVCQDIVI